MNYILSNLVQGGGSLLWVAGWLLGGWLLARGCFRLERRERFLAGLGLGLVLQTFFANLTARLLGAPSGFWLASALTFAVGGIAWGLSFRRGSLKANLRELWAEFFTPQTLLLVLLTAFFHLVGRGLSIFDDYQNLPVVSLLARGEIPPRFALDPSVPFDYHYLLLLFAAQVQRVVGIFPWVALDFARAVTMALALLFAALWAWRVTRSRVAATLTALVVGLAGGTRWMLLFLPQEWLTTLSNQLTLIGSGVPSGGTLNAALTSPWAIEGGGPLPFPFAFTNGLNTPLVMSHGGQGALGTVILALLLLLTPRTRGWAGAALSAVLLAGLALSDEIGFVFLTGAVVVLLVIQAVRSHSLRFAPRLWRLAAVFAAAGMVSLVQGGVLTGVARGLWERLSGIAQATSYYSIQFPLQLPPAFVSAHLGKITLDTPLRIWAALMELGPLILPLPLVFIYSIKAWRASRWFDAALTLAALLSILSIFFTYQGSAGVSASARLPGLALLLCRLMAVPLTWLWLQRRARAWHTAAITLGAAACLSGMVLLSISMVGIQKPVYSYYLDEVDSWVFTRHWNTLPANALVLDPYPPRAVTLLGLHSNSGITWYVQKEDYAALIADPNPYAVRAAGYRYVYIDRKYFLSLLPAQRAYFKEPCVNLLAEYTHQTSDYRRLYDLKNCAP